MENRKLSTYTQAQGGGRINSKNIVVSRPENPLNKGKSPNFDTAINFAHSTNSSRKFYSGVNSFNIKNCSKTNQSIRKNNYINITLFGSKNNKQTQTENDLNNNKIKNKTKLFALILSLFFILSTILTSGVFLIVNYVNKTNTNALSGDASLSIGKMSEDGNTINSSTYQKLLTALGNDTTSIRNSASINGGSPIVFQMGTVGSTPIYWQVVYQTADYITVWMTNSYTAEFYNYSGGSIKNSTLLGYTTGPYGNYGNYSQSVIRDLTKKIYDKVSTTFPVFADVVVAPSTVATVKDWQSIQKNAYYSGTSYWSITNGLGTNTYTGGGASNKADTNPYNWSYSSCMSDMFWIPSHYEVFNVDTATSASSTNGYWGLSSSTYIVDNSSTALDGTSTSQICWLRSGYSDSSSGAVRVYSSGSAGNSYVNGSRGVRPACHLSLSAMAATFSSTVTLDQQGGSGGTSSVTVVWGSAMPSITIPTRAGYTFGGYYTGTNGSGTQYYTASGASARNWDITVDKTLYAKWTANTYYVSYNGNGATNGSMSNSTHTYGTAKALTTNTYSRTGYKFLGWSTSSTATSATYLDGASVSNLTTTNGGTVTLYAVWQINTYQISTSVTPAGSGSISGGGTYNYNTTVTLTATPNSDYLFAYWEVDGVVNGTRTTLSFNATANKNIVAHFKLAKTYSYSTAGGEIRQAGNDFQNGTTSTTAVYKAVPYSGYYLIGWSVNGEVYKPNGTIYKERTLTLNKADAQGYGICAIFSTDANATPTTSYNVKTSTAISAQLGGEARAVGCDLSTLADTDTVTYIAVTDLGYKFDGWYIDGEKVSENLSCRLTKSQVLGKIVEARFSANDSNINDETNNTDEIF